MTNVPQLEMCKLSFLGFGLSVGLPVLRKTHVKQLFLFCFFLNWIPLMPSIDTQSQHSSTVGGAQRTTRQLPEDKLSGQSLRQTPWVRLGRALWHTAITRLGAETPAPRPQRRRLGDRPLVAPAALCPRVNAVTEGDCLQPEASSWRPRGGARGYRSSVWQQDGLESVQHCCPLLSFHRGNVVRTVQYSRWWCSEHLDCFCLLCFTEVDFGLSPLFQVYYNSEINKEKHSWGFYVFQSRTDGHNVSWKMVW